MRVYYSDHVELPLPDSHRFPMSKYRLTRLRLVEMGVGELLPAAAATDEELGLVHSAEYIHSVKTGTLTRHEIRRIGFPWSPMMYERSRTSTGGTLCAARAALEDSRAGHLAGGTHHAHFDWGQGFCIFNDTVVTARTLQRERLIDRALVVDLDVHHGNGTAVLCRNDPTIFTFSMHGERNFPYKKPPGDLDIGLPDETGDDEYLETLEQALWRVTQQSKPDIVLFIAGADPFVGDRLGKLSLSKEGLQERDQMVLTHFAEAGLPVAICLGGGYARDVTDIVDIHAATMQIACHL